jgi:3',5'-cyclic AMP phosphodiesterase CpdA
LATGDIHTKMWIIDEVRKIADDYDAIVFVGDYADDWDASPIKSIQTWKELRSFSHSDPKVKLVTGNHDYIYVNKTPTKQSGYNYVTQTLIDSPENRGLREWLHNLPITVEIDGVTYSHAGLSSTYKKGDNLWDDNSPLWVRPVTGDRHYPRTFYREIPQVFGHSPMSTCTEIRKNVWCIDTFSTYSDNSPIGDQTALEIVDGKLFSKIKLG